MKNENVCHKNVEKFLSHLTEVFKYDKNPQQ